MFGVSRQALLVMAGCAICVPAWADDVSTDSIISALRSGGGEGTRGIHMLAPVPAPAPAAAAMTAQPVNYGRVSVQPAVPVRRPIPVPSRREVVAAAPVTSDASQQEAHRIDLTVRFANNSAALTPEAAVTLSKLGQALTSNDLAASRFRIEGHTDSLGNHAYNRSLSAQRAQSVVDYLVAHSGVSVARLQPVGFGPDQPLVPTPDNVPEPRNRRVTVVNIGN